MKNIFKLIGIIAIVAVIGFSFAACGGDDGDDSGGSAALGDNLSLSGQVYTREIDLKTEDYKFEPYKGLNKTFISNVGGSGSITNGRMSFNVGAPSPGLLEDFTISDDHDGIGANYTNPKIVPSDVKAIDLDFIDIDLDKSYLSVNLKTSATTMEGVTYLYVDRNCTVSATGKTVTEDNLKVTYQNINLNLKKGWNVVNIRITTTKTTGSFSYRTGDLSSCKWVLDDDDDDD